MESLHLKYLKFNQKSNYSQLCQYLCTKLRAANFPDDDIDLLLAIKDKLSYPIYKSQIHLLNTEYDLVTDKLLADFDESQWSENMMQYRFMLQQFPDKRKYNILAWIIGEERKKYSFLHNMEGSSVPDMQDLLMAMDYIEYFRLSKYRKSCVIQQDVEFSHELSSVQEQFDMSYDAISQQLDNVRQHIYRVDRDSSGMLRIMRSMYEITERNVELEVDKCRVRVDYILFAMRHWISMSHEIKHIFNNTPSMMAKMDSQIETIEKYIEKILRLSFVMTRQPDCINVMQTPSTQRIVSKLREREFIKGSFLAYSPNLQTQWIDITSTCQMYLVGLNEYKSSDSVLDDFSPQRKTAYEGDLYEPSPKANNKSSSNNLQKFVGGDVCFPRVHMINQYLKRRCKEMNSATHKRKHEDVSNNNAAPEEIFSFVLTFKIRYDVGAPWHSFSEAGTPNIHTLGETGSANTRTLVIQTCSKPVAILVHASQKPPAEGKLFWCRFNPKWHMPLHEETSVSVDVFKKTVFEYTYDNFGRELSSRELDYLMAQIVFDQRQGYKLVAKSVLKDDAQYTDPPDNPPKRKSFWLWFYDILVFLGKGKGKPSTKCNMESPLKKHWRDGRVCLISRTQAQDVLTKLGANQCGAVIRVSESKARTLNVLSYNDSWGVGEKEVDGLDEHLRSKFALLWSESKESWIRCDLVCSAIPLNNDPRYKRFADNSQGQGYMSPSSPHMGCMSPVTGCLSPATPTMSYPNSFPNSPFITVQGTGTDSTDGSWRGTPANSNPNNGVNSQESYITAPAFSEQTYPAYNNSPSAQPYNIPNIGPGSAPSNMFHMMSLGNGTEDAVQREQGLQQMAGLHQVAYTNQFS